MEHLQAIGGTDLTLTLLLNKVAEEMWTVHQNCDVGNAVLGLMKEPGEQLYLNDETNLNELKSFKLSTVTGTSTITSSKLITSSNEFDEAGNEQELMLGEESRTNFLDLPDEILLKIILQTGSNQTIQQLGTNYESFCESL